ncbi:MAG: 4-hydroxy-tetrahydrodipicolinate synthase [Xanthobacteraceae bacterium]|nr:4-hydroxy-tetrahydrodipicolinate synthase [Xanthobacteraceae bacterium]
MFSAGRHVSRLSGFAPALPTPFDSNDNIDRAAFERLCDRQLAAGATALVVAETTGETPTLSPGERHELIRIAVEVAHARVPVVPVIAGAGSNCTEHAIALTRAAEQAGADAVLSVAPYYNKPTQAGFYAHFDAIAQSSGLPIILHDIPSRTGRAIADETVAQLAQRHAKIIGLDDATGDVTRPGRLRSLLGDAFRLMCGDDAAALPYLAQGGHGCISGMSNVAPGLCRSMYLSFRRGEIGQAQRLADVAAVLSAAFAREPESSTVKFALSLLKMMSPRVRLPMVEPSDETKAGIRAVVALLCERYSRHTIAPFEPDGHDRAWPHLAAVSPVASLRALAERLG